MAFKMKTLEKVKEEYIVAVMNHFDGNKTRAARALGISESGIKLWCKTLRLRGYEFKERKIKKEPHESTKYSFDLP